MLYDPLTSVHKLAESHDLLAGCIGICNTSKENNNEQN